MQDEILRQRLYRIFRIEDENYMVTMKVFYVYRWVERRAGNDTLDVLTDLRERFKKRKNTERLDWMFREMQSVNIAHLAAPPGARPPQAQSNYSLGWKLG